MGEKLPVITGKELLAFYIQLGCESRRIKGSHHVLKSNINGKMFVIPIHANEDLDRGTLKAIIQQSGLNQDEFIRLWEQK